MIHNYSLDPKHAQRKDMVQTRYSSNSDIAVALRGIFSHSFQYMKNMKALQEPGSKKLIRLPEEYKEYLAIYTTEYDDTYVLEAITAKDITELKEDVLGRSEQTIETAMNDPNAVIQITPRLVKIRKLNRLIGENLKLLYGYRCQICGKYIGEEYGAQVVESYYIEYYVKSLNNDASN